MESRELLHPAVRRSAWLAICPLANPLETPWIAGIFPDRRKARRRIVSAATEFIAMGVLGKCTRLGRSGS